MKLRYLVIILCCLTAGAARADFNDGVVALMMGEYDKALQTLLPLAETADHAYAQYFLARMYERGQGVEQDPDQAARWFREAATKGVSDAQYQLGDLYSRGEGVPKDLEAAYGWYSVAAHLGSTKAASALERAAANLSAEEMREARKLAADLVERYGVVPKTTARTQ